MKVLDKNQVLPGDIVIFQVGKNDLLGEIIGFLTNSKVSHAGMIYPFDVKSSDVEKRIVDVGDQGIRTYSFYDHPRDGNDTNTVYILRHPQYNSISPVIEKAWQYLNDEIKYNMPALFLLAGLLVYRKIPVTNALYPFVGVVLRKVCITIDDWIQQGHPERAMICSQFVYQCYHVCREPYTIIINNGNVQAGAQAAGVRLIDYCMVPDGRDVSDDQEFLYKQNDNEFEPLFFEQMSQTLRDAPAANSDTPLLQPPADVVNAISAFDKRVHYIAKRVQAPLEALFVTPADLFKHTRNLSLEGVMYLNWQKN